MKTRYTIPHKGLKEGSHEYEWRLGDEFWKARPESGIIGGDVAAEATLVRSATGVMRLAVRLDGSVTVPCDRCLEDCQLTVDYRGELAVKVGAGMTGTQGAKGAQGAGEEQPFDGEVMWIAPGEGEIDLEQYIYESVVLSLPLQRVHPEDVHGQPLCNPAMLERFKIVTEEEFNNLQ